MKPDYSNDIKMNETDHHFSRYIAKQLALLSGQLKKYELLSGKGILPTETHREMNKQLFQYTTLETKLDQQNEALKEHGEKAVKEIEENKLEIERRLSKLPSNKQLIYDGFKNELHSNYQDIKKQGQITKYLANDRRERVRYLLLDPASLFQDMVSNAEAAIKYITKLRWM